VRRGLEGTLALGQQVGEPVDALGADNGDRQLDLIGIQASDRTVTGVHQDQRVEAIGSRKSHELGHHATHRVAEEGVPPPTQGIDQVRCVRGQDLERVVVLVGGLRARSVPPVVRCHRVPTGIAQRAEPLGEILLRPGEPVQ
jgi:hypothetical protein